MTVASSLSRPAFLMLLALIVVAAHVSIPVHRAHHFGAPREHPHIRANREGAGKYVNSPLGGDVWPVAIFWMFVEVGTPPRSFPVAIDSGSYTLDIPQTGCQGCVSQYPNNDYDASASSSSQPVPCSFGCSCVDNQCNFSNTYQTCDLANPIAPCTISGPYFQDAVSISGVSGSVPVVFGAINYQTSNFDQFKNIDGVMGLAGPPGNQNVFSSLFHAGLLADDIFSVCLHQGSHSNGTITVGGIDPLYYTGPIQYTPNTGGYQYYTMDLLDVTVGGVSVKDTGTNGAILDSGTNVLLLPNAAYASMVNVMQSNCTQNPLRGVCGAHTGKNLFHGKCYNYSPAEIAAFPPIVLQLNGVTLQITGKDYLNLGVKQTPDLYCFGVRPTGVGGFLVSVFCVYKKNDWRLASPRMFCMVLLDFFFLSVMLTALSSLDSSRSFCCLSRWLCLFLSSCDVM